MKKHRPKCIFVKLSHGHTAAGIILLILTLIGCISIIESSFSPVDTLCFLPVVFPIIILCVILSWSVALDEKGLTVKRLFIKRKYPYSQLKEALIRNYSGEIVRESLELRFANGRRVRILSSSRNYISFKNELMHHKTIRQKFF